jgi:hypothetical protein
MVTCLVFHFFCLASKSYIIHFFTGSKLVMFGDDTKLLHFGVTFDFSHFSTCTFLVTLEKPM